MHARMDVLLSQFSTTAVDVDVNISIRAALYRYRHDAA